MSKVIIPPNEPADKPAPAPDADLAPGFAEMRAALARLLYTLTHPPAPPVRGYIQGRY